MSNETVEIVKDLSEEITAVMKREGVDEQSGGFSVAPRKGF
jgi:hypothetical protein